MTAQLIDGKAIAQDVRANVAAAVKALPGQPTLAVILVGEDPASQVYVNSKIKQTEECGMRSLHRVLPADSTQYAVEKEIKNLIVNGDSMLVIKQMTGAYKVNSPNLIKLYNEAMKLKAQFDTINFQHVYREDNKRADELANELVQ